MVSNIENIAVVFVALYLVILPTVDGRMNDHHQVYTWSYSDQFDPIILFRQVGGRGLHLFDLSLDQSLGFRNHKQSSRNEFLNKPNVDGNGFAGQRSAGQVKVYRYSDGVAHSYQYSFDDGGKVSSLISQPARPFVSSSTKDRFVDDNRTHNFPSFGQIYNLGERRPHSTFHIPRSVKDFVTVTPAVTYGPSGLQGQHASRGYRINQMFNDGNVYGYNKAAGYVRTYSTSRSDHLDPTNVQSEIQQILRGITKDFR
ncbi:uncharacterized protein LOC143228200 [Tachypleus tridentatus]|uniref:uncharacterized protein LOC143228200 n=1 Tax=Tachypleus tridentatus TaxID=6853 RepID=UPI003FCFCF4F